MQQLAVHARPPATMVPAGSPLPHAAQEESDAPRTLLRVEGMSVATRGGAPVRLLDGVSLAVAPREVLAMVGESGCGKTLTCLSLLGLRPPATDVVAGTAVFDGIELLSAGERALERLRGRRIAMVFQDATSALNPVHRIGGALVRSLKRHRGLGDAAATAEAVRLLDRVRIPRPETRLRCYPHELSGGMNQRVMIAVALTGNPDLLIADEPTTALDVTVQKQVLDLLAEIRTETGMAMILISHDLGVVAQIADRVCVMYCGRVLEEAPAHVLFAAPSHPYTAGLLASMPPDPAAEHPAATRPIRGVVASFAALPGGCHFHPRCDRAGEGCSTRVPALAAVRPAQRARCHYPLADPG